MQTAYYILKDHPKFNEFQFVVMPHCREHIHAASDIPRSFAKTEKMAKELFRNVDTTTYFSDFKDKDYWFIEDQDTAIKEQILK